MHLRTRVLALSSIACGVAAVPAAADAVLDGTTGSTGTFSGDFEIPAAVGRQAGGNLFHSFERFSVRRGESATFTGPVGIDNVISRVTGDEASRINGRLASTIPGADFFFLNPAGVVFGPAARLDVDGSFHVSTADELRFADRSIFSARDPAASSFTVAAPEAFGFLGADAGGISVDRALLGVPAGETLSLAGGPITIDGGMLVAAGGRIRLAAVDGPGEVDPRSGEAAFGTGASIRLTDAASVNTNGDGGGEVRIAGNRIVVADSAGIQADNTGTSDSLGGVFVQAGSVLVEQAGISANAVGSGDAGRIVIEARETVEVRRGASIASNSRRGAAGDAGPVRVEARRLVLDGEGSFASLESMTFRGSEGDAGRVVVTLTGPAVLRNGGFVSSQTLGAGDAGDVRLEAGRLSISGSGSEISSDAREGSTGAAGNVVVVAAGDVEVRDRAFLSSGTRGPGDAGDVRVEAGRLLIRSEGGVGSVVRPGASGSAGDVIIAADEVDLRGGAFVSTNTFGEGDAGAVRIEAGRLSVAGRRSSVASAAAMGSGGDAGAVSVSASTVEVRNGAEISSATDGEGDAGTVLVEAQSVLVANGSISTLASRGLAEAGEIIVGARSIELRAGGGITSDTSAGDAGPITVVADRLQIEGGFISSQTFGDNAGGPVLVHVERLVIRNGGFLSSDTHARGDAGIVLVDADQVRIDSGRISSDSLSRAADGGDAGNVLVTARRLFVGADGAISSSTAGGGRAGQVVVVADESTVLGLVGTSSTGAGPAGTVALAGERFEIQDGGVVTSQGTGQGAAGNILLRTEVLMLDDASITTQGQEGGRITTDEEPLRLIHLTDSQVTSDGIQPAPGDSIIELRASTIVLNSSEVTSLTGAGEPITGSGEASLLGDLTVISPDSTVAASSTLEVSGLESDITAGIEVLPGAFFDVSGQLRESCAARQAESVSSFVQTGQGGVAAGPDALLPGTYAGLVPTVPGPVDASAGRLVVAALGGCDQ